MKIIAENKTYVQKKDIAIVNSICSSVPVSFVIELMGDGSTFIVGDFNHDEFVCFENPTNTKFLESIDFPISLDDVRNMSIEELLATRESMIAAVDRLAGEYNALPMEERKDHEDMSIEHTLLTYKIYDLEDFIAIVQGKKKLVLPEGIEPITPNPVSRAKRLFATIKKKFQKN